MKTAYISDIINLGGMTVAIGAQKEVSCFGGNDGTATATVTGTANPFTFLWSPAGGNTSTANNLIAGNYTVSVTDTFGCIASANTVIEQPDQIRTIITATNTTCNQNNGNASVSARNGTGPYTYLWSPGELKTASITNLSPGKYIVTVTDSKGCSKIDSAIIEPSAKPKITINASNILCHGQQNGTATVIVTEGTAPYQYSWSNGEQTFSTQTIENLKAGIYKLRVTDALGCSNEESATIINPDELTVSVTSISTSCGVNNGSATAQVTGGTMPYRFLWNTGGSNNIATNLSSGAYRVTVTDASNCKKESGPTLIYPSNTLKVSLGNDTIICPGNDVILNPGKFATYTWHDNTHTPTYKAVQTGQYSVVVTDFTGCTATASMKVNVTCQEILFPNAFTPNADRNNDAFGPLGTLSGIKNYTMRIYNRWGQVVFSSTNPYQKWDGTQNGSILPSGAFIWMAEFAFNGMPKKMLKGTVVLIK